MDLLPERGLSQSAAAMPAKPASIKFYSIRFASIKFIRMAFGFSTRCELGQLALRLQIYFFFEKAASKAAALVVKSSFRTKAQLSVAP